MTIYIDLIFLENFFMNFIIIYATSIVLKKQIKILRIIIGSCIGAAYAIIYYVSNMKIYSNIFLKIILSIVIVYISFNSKTLKSFLRELLIFYLTSFTFGGVTIALLYFIGTNNALFKNGVLEEIHLLKTVLIAGLIGFFIIILSFKTIKNKIKKKDMKCNVKIKINNREIIINAIIDTGNFLKEPITGNSVVIVESDALKQIIPEDLLNNLEEIINGEKIITEEYISKIKIIPYSALGTESGLLLGIKPDEIFINYQEKSIKDDNAIIGIYNKKITKAGKYSALVGMDIIEKL